MGSRARGSTGALYFDANGRQVPARAAGALAVRAGRSPVMTKTALVSWRDILTLLVLAVVLAAAVAFGLWLATLLTQ
jgi:hypothetical protein